MDRRGWGGGKKTAGLLGLLAVLAVGTALLTPQLGAQEDAQPQAQAVRLSYVDGDVRIVQGGQVLADPALVNTPLFAGTQITTGDEGRAELQFDDGSVVRLAPNSSLTLTSLSGPDDDSDGAAEIVLNGGLGYFELQGASQGEQIQVHFADSTVTDSGSAVLRIDLDNPPGELAVFSGNAHLQRGDALGIDLAGGESITLNGGDPSQYVLAGSIEPDSWDTWNSDRDQALTAEATDQTGAPENESAAAAAGEASPDNPAWSDLDANGSWYDVPGAGEVWSPNDAANAGWDPYGDGSWMWEPEFGYVWVSAAPWGYLPYEYGSWNYFEGFGWGWSPRGSVPWWRRGRWDYRIGSVPFGYHHPDRPYHDDGGWRHDGGNLRAGFDGPSHPLVAVRRNRAGRTGPDSGAGLIARDRYRAAAMAGHTERSLRPSESRPRYHDDFSAGVLAARPAYVDGWTHTSSRDVYGGSGSQAGSFTAPARGYTAPTRTFAAPVRNFSGSEHRAAGHFSSGRSSSYSRPSGYSRGGSRGGGGARSGGGGGGRGGGHR